MQRNNYLEDAVNCNECLHKDVCSFKKEDGKKQIPYLDLDYISVKVTCNHFGKIQNQFVLRDGLGKELIECLRNPPTGNATASADKSCKGCRYENNTIPFDQSPCWGCKENYYLNYTSKEEKE